MVPTFGPSGRQERLNCWEKNRLMKTRSHFSISSAVRSPSKAALASASTFDGLAPYRTT